MAKRLVLFNHTGSISNTPSIYNLGRTLAENYRVLMVDADPQCSLTRLTLGEGFDRYYLNEHTRLHNLKDGVRNVFHWHPDPIKAIACPKVAHAQDFRLLPGHPNLSEYDFLLGYAHDARDTFTTLGCIPGAFNELMSLVETKYDIDFTLINLAPGLSPTNQNLFLHSDVFAIPACHDPFFAMALRTMTAVLPRWSRWKSGSMERLSDSSYPLRPGIPKFGGTLVPQCGDSQATHVAYAAEINAALAKELIPLLATAGMTFSNDIYAAVLNRQDFRLGELPQSQDARLTCPLTDVANKLVTLMENA